MSEDQTAEYMREALRIALENVDSGQGGPFGALVVRAGEVMARSGNRVLADNDPTAHAEMLAIRKACRRLGSFQLEGCDIYSSCEPCPMCLGAIYWARPARVFFANDRRDAAAAGFDDQFIYDELLAPPEGRAIPMHRLEVEDARAALLAWRNKEHRVPY